jgi:hypothetical protein
MSVTRITSSQPFEIALQAVADRLATALQDAGPAELVAVLFVKIPSEAALADQAARELLGNRGVVQEYLSGEHGARVEEMTVDNPDL